MYKLKIKSLGVNVELGSIRAVKEYVFKLQSENDELRGSTWDWNGSVVYRGNKKIGKVSYNGRVWSIEDNELELVD